MINLVLEIRYNILGQLQLYVVEPGGPLTFPLVPEGGDTLFLFPAIFTRPLIEVVYLLLIIRR